MVGSVPRGTVAMPVPSIVTWDEVVDEVHEIRVTAGTGLKDGEARRRMGSEYREQPISSRRYEARRLGRDIEGAAPAAGLDGDGHCIHQATVVADVTGAASKGGPVGVCPVNRASKIKLPDDDPEGLGHHLAALLVGINVCLGGG